MPAIPYTALHGRHLNQVKLADGRIITFTSAHLRAMFRQLSPHDERRIADALHGRGDLEQVQHIIAERLATYRTR